ncbi:hypothetical protein EDD15DRAFT_1290122 [Pisolithus albus]|nr:hypothetical protein EDD15DRAFT_1290122 [Pisolithus albus]
MSNSNPQIIRPEELNPGDIIILVVGPTGSGKSSFVSRASGIGDDIVGHDLVSKTTEIMAVKYTDEESGQGIVLVDTPGLRNTSKDDSEVLYMFTEWSRKLKERGLVIAGILYFHRMSDNRMPTNPLRALCVIGESCGGLNAAFIKTILTLTMWDDVGEERGDKRLTELKSMPYWRAVLKFMDDVETARELVREVIRNYGAGPMSNRSMAPADQECSRLELVEKMETLAERQLAILRKIGEESRNISDSNAPTLRELESEYEQLRSRMDETWKLCIYGQPCPPGPDLRKPPIRRFLFLR